MYVIHGLRSSKGHAIIGHSARQMFTRHPGFSSADNYSCAIRVHFYSLQAPTMHFLSPRKDSRRILAGGEIGIDKSMVTLALRP